MKVRDINPRHDRAKEIVKDIAVRNTSRYGWCLENNFVCAVIGNDSIADTIRMFPRNLVLVVRERKR